MEISVVVPTYNRRDLVQRTLDSIFRQNVSPSSFEVIVVVDGSTDGTSDALRRLRPPCHFRIIEQENRGLAGARNTGFRAAAAPLILFLDDDMECEANLISVHLTEHQNFDPVVVFGALFTTPDSPPSLALECFHREIGAFHLKHAQHPAITWDIRQCVFSNTSLPKQMLTDAGGFDEAFRMREDLELGIRLEEAGLCFRYEPEAKAYQHYEKTSADLIRDAAAFAKSDVLFARKHPGARIRGRFGGEVEEPRWKEYLRGVFVSIPVLERALLAPLCLAGEAFVGVPLLRNIGVRALQARRRVHWLRVVRDMMGMTN
jgi:glycosyltransferase involved in cell wall biosynthesis